MKWLVFILFIIGVIHLGNYTHQYVSGLSLIEVGHTTDKVQNGWQFWNGQTETAKFAPIYSKVDSWNIFITLWPATAATLLSCILLIPISLYLLNSLLNKEIKAAKQLVLITQKQTKNKIADAELNALNHARSELADQIELAQQAERFAIDRERKARNIESTFEQKIGTIQSQYKQAIQNANKESVELRQQLAIAEKRKNNASATAERRRRKLIKKTTLDGQH